MSDISAWINELMEVHGNYLKRTASIITGDPFVAEDLVQETFLCFYRNGHQFRKQAHVRTYLYRILMNNIKMHYRKNKSAGLVLQVEKEGVVSFENRSVQIMDLHQAVSKLKPIYRQMIALHYFEELSIDDIAKAMDMNKSTVKMRLKRAREQMHRHLSQGGLKNG